MKTKVFVLFVETENTFHLLNWGPRKEDISQFLIFMNKELGYSLPLAKIRVAKCELRVSRGEMEFTPVHRLVHQNTLMTLNWLTRNLKPKKTEKHTEFLSYASPWEANGKPTEPAFRYNQDGSVYDKDEINQLTLETIAVFLESLKKEDDNK